MGSGRVDGEVLPYPAVAARNLDELVREYNRVREYYLNGDTFPIVRVTLSPIGGMFYIQDRRVISQKYSITCTRISVISFSLSTTSSVEVTFEQSEDDLKLESDRRLWFGFDFSALAVGFYYLGTDQKLKRLEEEFSDLNFFSYSFGGPEIRITPSVDVEALVLPHLLP